MNAMGLFKNKLLMVIDGKGLLTAACRSRLEEAGASIIGPVGTVDEAQAVLSNSIINGAILDLRMDDHMIVTLAGDLEALDVPFIFATSEISPFDGFVLDDDPSELGKIAEALFHSPGPPTLH